jgi:chorismate synthase
MTIRKLFRIRDRRTMHNKYKQHSRPGRANAGYVYVFKLGIKDWHKIGRSNRPRARLSSLRAGNPLIEEVLAIQVENVVDVEGILHARYRQFRIEANGVREIFRLDDTEIGIIREFLETGKRNQLPSPYSGNGRGDNIGDNTDELLEEILSW